jgi:iron complex outermembrane receptor protein
MNLFHHAPRPARSCYSYLLASLLVTAAFAQTAPAPTIAPAEKPAGDTLVMEKFVTTGSSIKRTDSEKVLPVTVFHTEQIEARNSSTSLDLLASIPQITNIPNNETPVNAVAARGGNANVSLRGLASGNTLVLLNGRRVAYTPYYTAGGAVNVNVLPTTGLARIEVLRDGASSLYGADAVAGVINYITNPNVNGGTFTVRYFQPEHAGGKESTFNLNYGKTFANGKGRFVFSGSYLNRDAIYTGQREASDSPDHRDQARANTTGVTDAVFASNYLNRYSGLSVTSPNVLPAFHVGPETPTTANSFYMFYDANGAPVIPGALGSAQLPATSAPNYLGGAVTIGQPFSWRNSLFSRLEYDLTDRTTAFIETLGYFAHSTTGRQPVATTWGDSFVTIGVDNPYNPYGSKFAGSLDPSGNLITTGKPLTILQKLVDDSGVERTMGTDGMYRVLGGVKGKFGSTWDWETAGMFSAYRMTDIVKAAVRDSLIRSAALKSDALAWNPFNTTWKVVGGKVTADQAYKNPADVVNPFLMRAVGESHSKIASWDFRTSGEIVDLWAGPILGSAGAEFRYNFNELHKAPYVGINPPGGTNPDLLNNDIMVMSPKYDYAADRTLYAGYAETVIPLVAPRNGLKLTQSLNLTASVRHERYDDFGTATKPKFGIDWKPVKGVLVRASYNQGFLAPDLATMHQPTSFSVASPPGSTDTTYNSFFGSAPAVFWPGTRNYSLSNGNLQPEESKGITAGVVVEIPGVKGLSVSVDYYEIEQANLLVDAASIYSLTYDYSQLLAYTQSQLAAGKSILDIATGKHDGVTDASFYAGNPYVLRAAVRPDQLAAFQSRYAALPQSQWVAPFGEYLGTIAQTVNSQGRNFTNGYDIQLDYDLPKTPIGQFRVTTNWTKFLNKFTKLTPTSPKNDDIIANILPEWRSNTTIQWRKGALNATLSATWQSAIRTGLTFTKAQYDALGAPSWIKLVTNSGADLYYEKGYDSLQLNLGVGYKFASDRLWLKNTSVRLGINNLLDEDAPITGVTGTGYSGATGTSLWVGRAYSINLTRMF